MEVKVRGVVVVVIRVKFREWMSLLRGENGFVGRRERKKWLVKKVEVVL